MSEQLCCCPCFWKG